MRESSGRRSSRFAAARIRGRQADNQLHHTRHQLLPATVLAVAAALWMHTVLPTTGSLATHAPYLGLDFLLALPVAGAAVWAAGVLRHRLGLGDGLLARTGVLAAGFTVLFVPLATVQGYGHAVLGGIDGAVIHQHSVDPAGLAGYGLSTALQTWPAVLVAALLGVVAQRLLAEPALRRRAWRRLRATRRPATVVAAAGALVGGVGLAAVLPASPAVAQAGGCDTADTRTYNVSAIDITITINRHGDNDPYGYMYVLDENLQEVREFEEKLRNASATEDRVEADGSVTPWPEVIAQQIEEAEDAGEEPEVALVSNGLDQDLIQPLVLRARLGECVVINFTNQIGQDQDGEGADSRANPAPVSGSTRRLYQQPGGVPAVSIDMQGVTYDAAGGAGGQEAGNNAPSLVAPGDSEQYRFFLDPAMGEGTKVFRSGGESTQLTAHGLFGALIAEPPNSTWHDPDTGEDRTDQAWSNWEAMIRSPGHKVPAFREFTILYHEVGDEVYTLRRPLRENFGGGGGRMVDPFDPSREIGGALPMIDRRGPDVPDAFFRGGGSTSYRPGGKALNYRSESFFRRLQHETAIVVANGGTGAAGEADALREQLDNKSLGYSSYAYGDPATPVAESYLGEPTKTRLAHVGMEQLHVHHQHGGAIRWRQNPNADDADMDGGLDKTPIQDATSVRLDSQTISPEESFNLEHECGAGGCQAAPGDFLFHCHIAHHYISGMWGIWRVFDTGQDADRRAQDDLAPLPDQSKPAAGVTSAALLGTRLAEPDGRLVVLEEELTDPEDQVALEDLVQDHLPPQGERQAQGDLPAKHDATVLDWTLEEDANGDPLYLGEPDYGDVNADPVELRAWENYRSDTPGVPHPILFNPGNGRPAFPAIQPHLGERPPFAPNEHSGAPYLGETVNENRPDGLCPAGSQVRTYNLTAVSVPIQMTDRELDPAGMLFALNEEFIVDENGDAELVDGKVAEPLAIRSNVGDCVAVTMANQIDRAKSTGNGFKELAKTNMHTHFVQFDPLGSDGVIVGLNYEQSVFTTDRNSKNLVGGANAGDDTITVNNVGGLHAATDPGIAIAIGIGTPEFEIRTITDADPATNELTFDRDLDNNHPAGVQVSVEFVQYRWYSDVDSGTVFWHDHVDGIISWAHGLFGAHIIEPRGSTYHDPVTGEEVRSGTIVDIRNDDPNASVGVGQQGSFREFMMFLHNGRPASQDMFTNSGRGNMFGQECEEGSINLRAAPLGERSPIEAADIEPDPDGAPLDVDPTGTDQRFEFNGDFECRNTFLRGPAPDPDNPDNGNTSLTNEGTVSATTTTVDPHAFSSVTYGDPPTPLLRAYAGDDVVIRSIGVNERAEALRFQGHRFRAERFNPNGQRMDTMVIGISERWDFVLDGGAGGPSAIAGDYLYYSSRTFAIESGAWGLFRVHDTLQDDPDEGLKPLPDNAPPAGQGFPLQEAHEVANSQENPGPAPEAPDPDVVSNQAQPCPRGAPLRIYSVTAFDHPLPTEPFSDTEGVVYALTSDVQDIRNGVQEVEPLALRVNHGECLIVQLRNRIQSDTSLDGTGPGSRYGGSRVGFELGILPRNPQTSGGAAIGLNPDTTVAAGENGSFRFYADQEVGTTIFQNLGSPASLRHGGYGLLIVEPAGSQWFDSETGEQLDGTHTSTEAVIDPPNEPAFREFALTLQTTDQQRSRSVIPYADVIAGSGINSLRGPNDGAQGETRAAPIAGAPPGTRGTNGSWDKGFNHVNYHTEPLTERIGLTDAPGHVPNVDDSGWFVCQPAQSAAACDPNFTVPADAFSDAFRSDGGRDDPDTAVLEAHAGDRTVLRVGVAASDQLHSFVISGHVFPLEPEMAGSELMSARTLTAGQTLDAWLVGGAGGNPQNVGDYTFHDGRQAFTRAGMWGLLRVQAPGSGGIIPLP